jgi:murein DD-endopeptidase MepM/ murein hydrolase activator NlpD
LLKPVFGAIETLTAGTARAAVKPSRPARKDRRTEKQPEAAARHSSGFTIPLPPLGTTLVAAGILLFAAIAINWSGIPAIAGPRRYLLEPPPDMAEAERKLAFYTGSRFPAITPPPGMETAAETMHIPLDDLTEALNWTVYTVKKGDTVSGIAKKFSLSKDAVIASNNIHNVRRLPENMVLRIPNIDGIPYTVKPGDSLAGISQTMGVPLNAILDANDLASANIQPNEVLFIPGARMAPEAMKLALGELMIYPIQGRLTDGYGWRNDPKNGARRFHAAVDLAAPTGTRVQSVMDGTAAVIDSNPIFGNYIIVRHSGGYLTLYAHLNKVSVQKGAAVKQGEKIGEVGNTGYSTGSHLHFVLYKNGRAVNPLDFLQR